MSYSTMSYFNGLFRLFTREGDRERATVMQNKEAYRLEYCPDWHLAQISLRKGAGSMFCTVMIAYNKGCHTQDLSKNAQLQATVKCSCLVLNILLCAKSCLNSEYNVCGMESKQMPLACR
jgi:hypothetical protein